MNHLSIADKYPWKNKEQIVWQFTLFTVMGGIATAAHYAVLVVLVRGLYLSPVAASAAGYLVGALVSYILNFKITFRSHKQHLEALPRFLGVAVIGLGLNTSIMAICTGLLSLYYLVGQVLATVLVLIWNFVANRLWTFNEQGDTQHDN